MSAAPVEWYVLPHAVPVDLKTSGWTDAAMARLEEARRWCEERCGPESCRSLLHNDGTVTVCDGRWFTIYGQYYFHDADVAFEFKMRWS